MTPTVWLMVAYLSGTTPAGIGLEITITKNVGIGLRVAE